MRGDAAGLSAEAQLLHNFSCYGCIGHEDQVGGHRCYNGFQVQESALRLIQRELHGYNRHNVTKGSFQCLKPRLPPTVILNVAECLA